MDINYIAVIIITVVVVVAVNFIVAVIIICVACADVVDHSSGLMHLWRIRLDLSDVVPLMRMVMVCVDVRI